MAPSDSDSSTSRERTVREFVEKMTQEEKMLVTLRDELYNGQWDEMEIDLEERLAGRPYMFKLTSRIEDDLARIRRMKVVENENDINLKDHI